MDGEVIRDRWNLGNHRWPDGMTVGWHGMRVRWKGTAFFGDERQIVADGRKERRLGEEREWPNESAQGWQWKWASAQNDYRDRNGMVGGLKRL